MAQCIDLNTEQRHDPVVCKILNMGAFILARKLGYINFVGHLPNFFDPEHDYLKPYCTILCPKAADGQDDKPLVD